MKKLSLALTAAALCSVSSFGFASDRSLSVAWPGVSDSVARIVKEVPVQSIAASVAATAVSLFTGRSDAQVLASKPEPAGTTPAGSACPYCPDLPCM